MILFISDLHLQASRPKTTQAFLGFLGCQALKAKELWILGDLFEFWVGDDDRDPFNETIAEALTKLHETGVKICLMRGNRDFLLGKKFAHRCGAQLVGEPALISYGELRVVLLHGDAQCTDDIAYQQFRRRIRNPFSLTLLHLLPLALRHKLASRIRQRSGTAKRDKAEQIMDVNPAAIELAFRTENADVIIHGHTHRPALHSYTIDGKARQRWVLSDWHDKATWLEAGPDGLIARTEM